MRSGENGPDCSLGKWTLAVLVSRSLGNCEVKKPGQTLVGGGTGSSWAPGLKSAFFHRFCFGCSHA